MFGIRYYGALKAELDAIKAMSDALKVNLDAIEKDFYEKVRRFHAIGLEGRRSRRRILQDKVNQNVHEPNSTDTKQ